MPLPKRYFGTDGVRGRVGVDPMTAEFVLRLGWALGCKLKASLNVSQNVSKQRPQVLIGKDTRLSGYMLESALEAGLTAAGVDTYLLGPMPTPAIAFLTRHLQADAGIVISASHNLYPDNGIKIFSATGEKLPPDMETAIETLLAGSMQTVETDFIGKAYRVPFEQGRQAYQNFCIEQFPQLSLSGWHIVVDCANGANYEIAPLLFQRLGAQVTAIHVNPDGKNINAACGSTHPEDLQARVVAEKADLGIAFDGDGDRVILVDAQGKVVDGDGIVYILAQFMRQRGELQGGVVGTVMSNLGLELAIRDMGVAFERTAVGDKYVKTRLTERGWLLGGESSGHVIQLQHHTTGDGLMTALSVLAYLTSQDMALHTAMAGMVSYPQVLLNIACSKNVTAGLNEPAVVAAIESTEQILAGRGRVLIRPSGTEPVVRIMVEGESLAEIQQLADTLASVLKKSLASA